MLLQARVGGTRQISLALMEALVSGLTTFVVIDALNNANGVPQPLAKNRLVSYVLESLNLSFINNFYVYPSVELAYGEFLQGFARDAEISVRQSLIQSGFAIAGAGVDMATTALLYYSGEIGKAEARDQVRTAVANGLETIAGTVIAGIATPIALKGLRDNASFLRSIPLQLFDEVAEFALARAAGPGINAAAGALVDDLGELFADLLIG